jgi:hypothetical protein
MLTFSRVTKEEKRPLQLRFLPSDLVYAHHHVPQFRSARRCGLGEDRRRARLRHETSHLERDSREPPGRCSASKPASEFQPPIGRPVNWFLAAFVSIVFTLPLILVGAGYGQDRPRTIDWPVQPETTSAIGRYMIVDTGQTEFFDNYSQIGRPIKGQQFYGQDGEYTHNPPSYRDNGDGTVTDRVTGLTWQRAYAVMTLQEAAEKLKTFDLSGHRDWRLPTVKQLYSLILFSGVDPSGPDMSRLPSGAIPFLDTASFEFKYGSNGERVIDAQIPSCTLYQGRTMGNQTTVFGVNFADGRIKGYPVSDVRSLSGKQFTVRFLRGNPEYGRNNFKDNHDGTISDLATGLMWQKSDSKAAMSWEDALAWVQQKNKENYLGHSDWRLPNAKELQSIVDYTRSLQATSSAAINPLFEASAIKDEGGRTNYPFYWSSTTHKDTRGGRAAVYVSFGEALGFFKPPLSSGPGRLQDVHGAGAQRSDPKTGNPRDFPQGRGPQGDVIRIYNYARLARNL